MSQVLDFVLQTTGQITGLQYTLDINQILSAIGSQNKGSGAPPNAIAGQFWIDDAAASWILKVYDGADWIGIGTIDPAANTFATFGVGGGSLGTAASKNTGTSGDTVPLCNGAITWSAIHAFVLASAGLNITLQTNDPGATGVQRRNFHNSVSPLANDVVFQETFEGNDSAGSAQIYARDRVIITQTTSGAERGTRNFATVYDGTLAERVSIGRGLVIGAPVGGDIGVGAINFEAMYENGRRIGYGAMTEVTLTDGATITPNFDLGVDFVVTLGGSRVFENPINVRAGQRGRIRFIQDATGSRIITFGTNYEFDNGVAVTLSTAPSAQDVLYYDCISATRILCSMIRNIS